MKNQAIVAKRYARALFKAAEEQGGVFAEIENVLGSLARSIEASEELASFLSSRNVHHEAKLELITGIAGELPQLLHNTIRLLFERNRFSIIPALYKAYQEIANEKQGKEIAYVQAPRELTAEEVKSISERFTAITGKRIEVEAQVDPALLGGLVVRIGDRLYDGSLRGKLARLEKQLHPGQAM